MEKELSEVERRVLMELSVGPASTIWKLCNVLELSHTEVTDTLEELLRRGLVRVSSRGWELAAEGRAILEKPRGESEGIRHFKKMVKFALPSDVERSKSVVKPFKKSPEGEQEPEEQRAG
jgi:predicted transcriptional regulator